MQQIIQGLERLPQLLQATDCKKLFLVVDASYPFLNIKEAIETLAVEKVAFSDFTPNPVYEQVCKGIELIQSEQCDAILAVGGGSAIDVAKCIKLAVLSTEGRDALIPPLVNTRVACDGSRLPLIAIPTTAGTGSESTHNAVMYFEDSKQTVTNDGILPDYAILEPMVLKTLPLYQKKCTMLDALCQAIESWWSVHSTDESKSYSRKAIELIMANWRQYIFGQDEYAAANIMMAANYGGRAINITATTAAHAMSYKITSIYGLPHGHAVAVCLPEIWQFMIEHTEDYIDDRGKEYLCSIFFQIANMMGGATPYDGILVFRGIVREMKIQYPVSSNRKKEIDLLCSSVNQIRLNNNPIRLTDNSIRFLYENIVK